MDLHKRPLKLIKQSQKDNDYSLVSLFINQAQFNNQSDFINYLNMFLKALNY